MKANAVDKLLDAILPAWSKCLGQPYGVRTFTETPQGTTYCNEFVQEVLNKLGYKELNNKRASQMVEAMMSSSDWLDVPGEVAATHAKNGSVVVAGWVNPDPNKSGHVCMVVPGECVKSGKWQSPYPNVPKVANVGPLAYSKIGIGANWAFGPTPKYFVLKASIVESQ